MVCFEKDRCKKFQSALNQDICVYLVAHGIEAFDEMFKKAKL